MPIIVIGLIPSKLKYMVDKFSEERLEFIIIKISFNK